MSDKGRKSVIGNVCVLVCVAILLALGYVGYVEKASVRSWHLGES